MDNTTLGSTTLAHIPTEFLNPKRKTNRVWTLILIVFICLLALLFWNYRQSQIKRQTQEIVPLTTPETMSMSDIEQTLAETEIPSFHETL